MHLSVYKTHNQKEVNKVMLGGTKTLSAFEVYCITDLFALENYVSDIVSWNNVLGCGKYFPLSLQYVRKGCLALCEILYFCVCKMQ